MGRLFGTDGVRGVAGVDLTCELALRVGRSVAVEAAAKAKGRPRVFIGRDTRVSGDMLEAGLAAGLCSAGADAVLLGVMPTPGVAWLVRRHEADAGIVISASHNPMEFNGIKIFAADGYKLSDEAEARVERRVLSGAEMPLCRGTTVGRMTRLDTGMDEYVAHLCTSISADLTGLRVAVDCANGAAFAVAQKLFPALGASCVFLGVKPDGVNINAGVGSTHPGALKKAVTGAKCDCGIAFDGDADRCLACDETGGMLDGDKIIALLALDMKQKGCLDGDTAVVTVMSNMGFLKFMQAGGVHTVCTEVGDRHVLEHMRQNGSVIGGEQSGHIILLRHGTTGDGILTAGKLLGLLAERQCPMSALNGIYQNYPQVTLNVEADSARKAAFRADKALAAFIERQQNNLMGRGRILVRPSGTEPKIRVMVEGEDAELIRRTARHIVDRMEHGPGESL